MKSNMKKIKAIIFTVSLSLLFTANLWGQETYKLMGKVLSEKEQPIEGAIVTINTKNVTTDKDGVFTFDLAKKANSLSVWAPGYFSIEQQINDRTDIVIIMIPENKYKYNESIILPFRGKDISLSDYTSALNIAKKDFVLGSTKIDHALAGQVSGLQVKRGSGMPGEGSYYNLRGIRSLIGDNAPLIVVDGAPYMPDKSESHLINGFSRDIFQAYNIQDIQNITILKGAEAALYGSMGSNGVILIETDGAASNDLETKVSYYGVFGVNWNNKRLPMLKGTDYTSYLYDAALTYYNNSGSLYSEFPFLQDPNNPKNYYLYNNHTDWQDLIYKNSFSTDNLFRVEGGDAIAKYDLSIGYAQEDGILKNTNMERYHARLNADVLVSSKLNIFFSAGLAYMNSDLQEQGISRATNPLLAAYAQSPVLSPYNKDVDGNVLRTYSSFYFGNEKINNKMAFAVSNPLAIVNTLDARTRQYDLNIRAGINYNPIRELTLTGTFGMFYNYDNEHMFIPGFTDKTIIPISDNYGTANNMVRDGVAETFNMFYNVNGRYVKTFEDIHKLNVFAGTQVVTTKNEYDAGEGRNTANDFYQTLGNTDAVGRHFFGYLNKWNWMNMYAHADYTFNGMVQAGVNMAVDGASSTGADVNRFYAYPSASVVWLGKGWKPFQNSIWLNKLNVRTEYSITGNSRFATNMGKFYYNSIPYDQISTIARAGIPNTELKPEKNHSFNVGLDLSVFQNRFSVTVDYFNNQISDMICAKPLSSVYGSVPYYANIGEMSNKGFELAVQASLIRLHDFEWIVGGNISHYTSKVTSLGGTELIITNGLDGARLITKVGEKPYQYYGYEVAGVFSTQADADKANLISPQGNSYQAGDMHFVDQNNDGIINDEDRIALGSATPKFFGGFYTQFRYKSIALSAEFSYSKGNKAYNAVRRELESMKTLGNQSEAVLNRWNMEGQVTDIPRASHNDVNGNSIFSERWIEDASYLRMKNITLSYSFDKKFLNFFRSGTIYVTGENLLTFTKYLGLDPEFSYSYGENVQGFDYAKIMQPKSVKLGVNLKF